MGAGSCFCGDPSIVLKWISVLSSVLFVGGAPDRSLMMLLDVDVETRWTFVSKRVSAFSG